MIPLGGTFSFGKDIWIQCAYIINRGDAISVEPLPLHHVTPTAANDISPRNEDIVIHTNDIPEKVLISLPRSLTKYVRYEIRGRVWLTTNLNVIVVNNRRKESWSRFWGNWQSTENVAKARLQMNICRRRGEGG